MKKLLMSVMSTVMLVGGLFAITSTHANNDCKEVEFDHETVCVSISEVSSHRFELETEHVDGSAGTLRCDIMLPDSTLKNIPNCNDDFLYSKSTEGRIKLWIRSNEDAPEDWEDKPSSASEWTYPQWNYDFGNEEWGDAEYDDDDDNSNGDLDNFALTTDDTTPSTNQWVNLGIEARDDDNDTVTDYTDTVNFDVYKKPSGSSTWTLTTSSTYFDIDSDYDDGYDFTSSDDGDVTLTDFIKFKVNNYSYKVRVYDENDDDIYKDIIFTVGSTSSNGDLDNFALTTDDTTPSTNQWVNLGIEARDDDNDTVTDYTDTVNFDVYKKPSGSSTWTLTTSSTYFDIDSDYDDGYDFTSSDDGDVTLTDFIKFKVNNYSYKVRVYDENDDDIYKDIIFTVGSTSSNGDLDNFALTTDDTTPSTNQWVNLGIEARDDDNDTVTDYTDTVNFDVYKKPSGSSTWTLTTSSTYFDIDSDYDDGYDFTSSDDGDVTLTDFIKFKVNNYSYKVRVYDENDDDIYKDIIFTVGTVTNNGNSDDIDNFYVTTNDSSPDKNVWIDVTIQARDEGYDTLTDYVNKVKFRVQRKSGTSWVTASTSYYSLSVTSYDFSSSDDGEKTIGDLIMFKQNGEYRLIVYDEDDINADGERIFDVNYNGGDGGIVDGFSATELDTVESIHDGWDAMIEDLKDQYSKLRNSTTWNTRSDKFYDDMEDILNDVASRTYDTYDEFYNGFLGWYQYTISIR